MDYPAHWEADVVLRDGGTCHIRPIGPADAGRLQDFHRHLSPETIYLRYFAPYPELSDKDVKRFTHVDHDKRVALVATVGDEIVGVGRYDKVGRAEAEVAFTVRDDHQGRGLGSVLLEHLAAAARERGIERFVAETLPSNRAMQATFQMAGYKVAQEFDEGVVRLAFDIRPTDQQREVARAREARAEAHSVEMLFSPRSVIVVGASRTRRSLGRQFLAGLAAGGFTGPIYAVHPSAKEIDGVRAFRRVSDAPGPIDMAILAIPADAVPTVIDDCARAGVHGLLVVSGGFAEAGRDGAERQRELVAQVRANGMRLIGPNALGLANTDSRVRLNAALTQGRAVRGRVALFTQSAAAGAATMERARRRGLGISSFISVGNRGDISSADALQYWSNDPATRVIGMYLEGIPNPNKFIRIARDIGRRIPIVVLRSGRTSRAFPLGPRVRRTTMPSWGVDQVMAQAGIIETDSLGQMLDVVAALACQPLPRGPRVGIVCDSIDGLLLAEETCLAAGLQVTSSVALPGTMDLRLTETLTELTRRPDVDIAIVLRSPPTELIEESPISPDVLAASRDSSIPVFEVAFGEENSRMLVNPGPDGAAAPGSVPVFGTIEEAVEVIRRLVGRRRWLETPRGEVPDLVDVDSDAAKDLVEAILASRTPRPEREARTVRMSTPMLTELLAHYGIRLWPSLPVASEAEAVAQADEVGWPVTLKTRDPRMSRLYELGGIRLNLENEEQLRAAYLSMSALLDSRAMSQLVVQRMSPPGVPAIITGREDPLFGPVVNFGVGGVVPTMLGDRAYQIPPISMEDAHRMVRSPKSARLLFGFGGNQTADGAALEDLVVRVGQIASDIPEIVRIILDPVMASPRGVAVLGASAWLRVADHRIDSEARRMADI